ncbi:GntR family transcriptional regulator [Antarctobacter sp.]|uniref:GntR family transcriptional regulator n=1 Tax=Antarctobacter sp. TaxID=1872577 RepID=UPI003A90D3D5
MTDPARTDATTSASLARAAIRDALSTEKWRPGEQLPAERGLSEMLGVNRMSLRQALLALENEGAVFRVDRKGWFVSQKRFDYDLMNHVSFERAAAAQGTATWTDLDQDVVEADAGNAALFGLNAGDPLLRIRGWGAFNGHRAFMHDVMINLSAAPDFAERLAGQSFTTVWIEHYGVDPRLSGLRIRPVRLEGLAQQILGCTNGAPGLYIRRIKTNADGQVIQIDREFWRFESLELHISPDAVSPGGTDR